MSEEKHKTLIRVILKISIFQKFTRLKDFDETFYTELIDLVKFPGFQEELKLTSLDNLAKLISGTRGAKFGESLLKLEEL